HHIVSDGWSLSILVNEIASSYRSLISDDGEPLAPLPLQYSDYATWQREWLQGDQLAAKFAFWADALKGASLVLELRSHRPRARIQDVSGSHVPIHFDGVVTSKLKDLTHQSGTTLFMLLLAAFGELLSRYSGQKDILIGSPTANRPAYELEALVGVFINM